MNNEIFVPIQEYFDGKLTAQQLDDKLNDIYRKQFVSELKADIVDFLDI